MHGIWGRPEYYHVPKIALHGGGEGRSRRALTGSFGRRGVAESCMYSSSSQSRREQVCIEFSMHQCMAALADPMKFLEPPHGLVAPKLTLCCGFADREVHGLP